MTVLSQFLDNATLARLSEHQIRTLNDVVEAQLIHQLITNQSLKTTVETALKAAVAAHP